MFDHCEGCPLQTRPKVPGYGVKGQIAIVGEAPGYTEALQGRPFVGESGKLLRETLLACGIHPEREVYYTNAVLCHPPANQTPTTGMINACRQRLLEELTEVQPKKILSTGGIALQALTDGRETSILKSRGLGRWYTLLDSTQVYWVTTVHPASVLRQLDFFRDFSADIWKLATHSEPIPAPKIYKVVPETPEEALESLEMLAQTSQISVDLETTGVDFWVDRILSYGFGAEITDNPNYDVFSLIIPSSIVDQSEDVQDQLLTLFQTYPGKMWFHNGKFDLQFLEETFGTSIVPQDMGDTILQHYALDERAEGRYGVHGLKELSKLIDIESYKFNFDKFFKLPEEERDYEQLYAYHTMDCAVTLRLGPIFEEMLIEESEALARLVDNVLVPGSIVYGQIERHGTLVDKEYLTDLAIQYEDELAKMLRVLQDAAESVGLHQNPVHFDVYDWEKISLLSKVSSSHRPAILQAYFELKRAVSAGDQYSVNKLEKLLLAYAADAFLYEPGNPFNPQSPKAKKLVAALGIEAPSTEKEDLWLAMSQQNAPPEVRQILDTLIEYRIKAKIKSTYIDRLLETKDENDRVHPDYLLFGTATGRPACAKPNLQNIPQVIGPVIRKAFIAPENYWFVSCDYSQLELRVAAHLSRDERMIQAFREGRDIHREVASAMFGKPPEEITYFERYLAKYVDFGVIYGRGAKSLVEGWEMEHLVQEGGTRWTIREAEEFIEAFLDQFPGLKSWMRNQRSLVHQNHYVETLMGRRRRFPLILRSWAGSIERQSINTPIQSLASDLTLTAVTRLHPRLLPLQAFILFTVYDSIAFEVPKGKLDEVVPMIQWEMTENLPVELHCPIRVDIEVGPNWGDLEKYDPEKHQ